MEDKPIDWNAVGEYWKEEYSKPGGHYHLASDRTQAHFGIHFCVVDRQSFYKNRWVGELVGKKPHQVENSDIKWGPDEYYTYHNDRLDARIEAGISGIPECRAWEEAYDLAHNAAERGLV